MKNQRPLWPVVTSKLCFTALFLLFVQSIVCAQTECVTRSGATETNEALAGSDGNWTVTGNTGSSDNVRSIGPDQTRSGYTNRLKITNFGFTIPDPSTILGITVSVERSVTASNYHDRDVMLVKGGVTQTGHDKATTNTWTTSDAVATYGNATDLWGNTWEETEINDAGFGVAIAAQRTNNSSGSSFARIDHVTVTVCYLSLIPLKIVNLSVTKSLNGKNDIRWVTTNEYHVKTIQVQKSANGIDFAALSNIAPKGTHPAIENHYYLQDHFTTNGDAYYRLKVIDLNGDHDFSEIKKATTAGIAGNIVIQYTNKEFKLGWDEQPGALFLDIRDMAGRILYCRQIAPAGQAGFLSIHIALPPKRYYIIGVKSMGAVTFRKVFVED